MLIHWLVRVCEFDNADLLDIDVSLFLLMSLSLKLAVVSKCIFEACLAKAAADNDDDVGRCLKRQAQV